MKIALQGNILKIIEADNVQFTVMKSWNKLKWDKRNTMLIGTADMELLDKMAGIVRLPTAIEAHRVELHRVQDAVDAERMNQDPEPLVKPPVKLSMYKHQTRAFNMALLTFGLVRPPEVNDKSH